jgi:hypothetical protein
MPFMDNPTQYFLFPYTHVSNNNWRRRTCEARAMSLPLVLVLELYMVNEFAKIRTNCEVSTFVKRKISTSPHCEHIT